MSEEKWAFVTKIGYYRIGNWPRLMANVFILATMPFLFFRRTELKLIP